MTLPSEEHFLRSVFLNYYYSILIFSFSHGIEHLREPSVRFTRSHLMVDESERIGHLPRKDGY